MLEKYSPIESLSVVLLGTFNPVIIQPFWLAGKGLIRVDEAEKATVEVIHNEIVKFELDWVRLLLTRSRCEFQSIKTPYFDPLRDLVIGIFKFLPETPIDSLGLNHMFDFSLPDESAYYNFGGKLTPLEIWSDELNDPRLLQLEILENKRKDGQPGSRRIRITPSPANIPFGVQININNHFSFEKNSNSIEVLGTLEKNWRNSFPQSKMIAESLLTKMKL